MEKRPKLLENNHEYAARLGLAESLSKGEKLIIDPNNPSLSFVDNSFDTIICLDILHKEKDPYGFIKNALRVLKENGTFIISVPSGSAHAFPCADTNDKGFNINYDELTKLIRTIPGERFILLEGGVFSRENSDKKVQDILYSIGPFSFIPNMNIHFNSDYSEIKRLALGYFAIVSPDFGTVIEKYALKLPKIQCTEDPEASVLYMTKKMDQMKMIEVPKEAVISPIMVEKNPYNEDSEMVISESEERNSPRKADYHEDERWKKAFFILATLMIIMLFLALYNQLNTENSDKKKKK